MTSTQTSPSATFQIAASRPLPHGFDLPAINGSAVEVRFGPERGFASIDDRYAFFRGADAVVTWISDRVDDAFLDAAGPQLRIVANFAVGFDNIDLAACARRGVIVTNTPDAVTDGTADCAVMLMLAAARLLPAADRFCRSGAWARQGILGPADWIGRPIGGANLLIVGAGRIGYATALRMIGFGVRTSYVARSRKAQFEQPPLCAQRVDLDEGLAEADLISIHTPLTPETRHLINRERLARVKPTAVLVSTARGPVIDEAALAEALAEKRLFAAGLDVFEHEPTIHPGLLGLDNVVMTPHYGSANDRSRTRMAELCAENIRAVLAGRLPVTPVVAGASAD